MDGCSRCSSVENIVDDFRNEWLLYGFEHVILHTSLSSYHRLTVLRCPIVPLPRSDLYIGLRLVVTILPLIVH
jgi:hypothetical protein